MGKNVEQLIHRNKEWQNIKMVDVGIKWRKKYKLNFSSK
jgi:hypothetical protein